MTESTLPTMVETAFTGAQVDDLVILQTNEEDEVPQEGQFYTEGENDSFDYRLEGQNPMNGGGFYQGGGSNEARNQPFQITLVDEIPIMKKTHFYKK